MIFTASLHENLKNLLSGRVIDGKLTPQEYGVMNVIYAMGKWRWDTFNFETDYIPDSYEKLDLAELRKALREYTGKLGEKMMDVASGGSYVFDPYLSETGNEICYLLEVLIQNEA